MGSTGENSAPRFVHKPSLRQEDDGNRLIFECELRGCPQPSVAWYRGDSVIREDERTYVRVQETHRRTFLVVLEVNDVVESDAGLYRVKAKNKFGEVAASINLNFSRKYLLLYYCTTVGTMQYILLYTYKIFKQSQNNRLYRSYRCRFESSLLSRALLRLELGMCYHSKGILCV